MSNPILSKTTAFLLMAQEQTAIVKTQHWLSEDYNQHIILDELYGILTDKVDVIAEHIIINYGYTPDPGTSSLSLEVPLPNTNRCATTSSRDALVLGRAQFNQLRILMGTDPIVNVIDEILIAYDSAMYKLMMVKRVVQ